MTACTKLAVTDNYAKDGGPGEVWHLCSFYNEPLRTWIKTDVDKMDVSSHTALKLAIEALKGYFTTICN